MTTDHNLRAAQGAHELLEQTLAKPHRLEVPGVSVSHDPRAFDSILFGDDAPAPVADTGDVHGYIRGTLTGVVVALAFAAGFLAGYLLDGVSP